MQKLRYFTAGESHGQALIGTIEGLPAGLRISEDDIFVQLQRRQQGHGRGGRMKIETDRARILTGVRHGKTLGSPLSLLIENRDWKNWQTKMAVEEVDAEAAAVVVPRPGHADYAGAVKYAHEDIRNVLERASARETATRVALGAIARKLLSQLGIKIVSHVIRIGRAHNPFSVAGLGSRDRTEFELDQIGAIADKSTVRCLDPGIGQRMVDEIDAARKAKDTVGGIFEVVALNIPVGLGSHVHWDRKLDTRVAAAMMSIPAMKGVEIGLGFASAAIPGSAVHDPIYYEEETRQYYRSRNHAGGLEGGITNGMPLVVGVAMKPISTLMNPLDSVNMQTKDKTAAHIERSDTCAVPAASVVGEAMLALVLAEALLEKFGGDSMAELEERYVEWRQRHG